jgi:hypothetical protein
LTLSLVQFLACPKLAQSIGPLRLNEIGAPNVGVVFHPPGHKKLLLILKVKLVVDGAMKPRPKFGRTSTDCDVTKNGCHNRHTATRNATDCISTILTTHLKKKMNRTCSSSDTT